MTGHDLTMTVECRTCPVRELQCRDCMVPVLLDLAAPTLRGDLAQQSTLRVDLALDPQERAAVTNLVLAGLVDAETASRARARLEPASPHLAGVAGDDRAVG
ncbi:MAG TPA: hypothetical protein PLG46_00960 [Ornithinibacter sp.]|jgi:hypothetical protein|nr:hypothetical protein [Dermatophilaceae bacterium]HQW72646.1 hypothetical protein [Ornithinibacter sp.]